jgi:hypothetical protein
LLTVLGALELALVAAAAFGGEGASYAVSAGNRPEGPAHYPTGYFDWPRPVNWCTRLSASSSLDVYAAAGIAITSSGWLVGSVSAFAIDSELM